MQQLKNKNYRQWILTPVMVLVDKPGFSHHEMAVQACISIQSTSLIEPIIVKENEHYRIALKAPTDFDCACAEKIIDSLLSIDREID